MYNYGFASVLLSLPQKGVNNVNAEAKEQGRDMQTPVDDSGIFTEISILICAIVYFFKKIVKRICVSIFLENYRIRVSVSFRYRYAYP